MTTTHAVTRSRASSERSFYGGMSVAILAAVCLGFGRSFFLRSWFPEVHVPPEPFFFLHGVVFLVWFLLLVTQTRLVAQRRIALHRTLGFAGGILAAAMVALGTMGAVIAARRPGGFVDVPEPPLQFLVVPLFSIVVFGALVGAALLLRRDLQAHKRLMVIASIAILDAAIARWPLTALQSGKWVSYALVDLYLVPMVLWDLATRRRIHLATLLGGLTVVLSQPLRLVVSGTAAWLAFARWLTGMPG